MNRAVIYARLSQADRDAGDTIEAQIEQCKELAEIEGYEVLHTYIDDGVSGKTFLETRPGLLAAYQDTQTGGYERLLMRGVQRFSRTVPKLSIAMATQFELAGVQLHTVRQGLIDLDDFGELVKFAADEHAANQYLETVRKNTMEGRYRRAGENKIQIGGQVVFGYNRRRVNPDNPREAYTVLEPHPTQKVVIRRIFREFLKGKNYTEIANAENERGILTNAGNKWEGSYVKRIIRRPDYMGVRYFGVNKSEKQLDGSVKRSVVSVDDESVVKQEVPAIIEVTAWHNAQIKADSIARKYPRGRNTYAPDYILRGRIECVLCGGTFHVKTLKSKGHIYFRYRHTDVERYKSCANAGMMLYRALLEDKVKEILLDLSDTDLSDLLENAKVKYRDERQSIEQHKDAHKLLSAKLDKARRLMLEDTYTAEEYHKTRTEIQREIDVLDDEIARLKNITAPEQILLEIDSVEFHNQMTYLKELGYVEGNADWFEQIDRNGVQVEILERADTELGARIRVHTVIGSAEANGGITVTKDA